MLIYLKKALLNVCGWNIGFERGLRKKGILRIVSKRLKCGQNLGTVRHYSDTSVLDVFDRKAKCMHRDWCATLQDGNMYDYLKEEVGDRVADRVFDITRKFSVCVELGCGKGHITKHLTEENVGTVFQCDISKKMLEITKIPEAIPTYKLVVDEEFLPFSENSIDLFISSLSFHWINNLPSVFKQIHSSLKPDGVLIASMFGGDTLFELRSSLQLAETEREGGFSPHISPFARVRDVGDLMTGAGYTMLTIDTDEIIVNYPSMFELLDDLRGMAESNVAWNRNVCIKRDTLLAAAAIYSKMYGKEDESIPATFQMLYLIGWKPHESQKKAVKRGSGQISMKTISNLDKEKTDS